MTGRGVPPDVLEIAVELELEVEPVHVTDVLQFNDKTFMNEGWLASHG